MNNIIAKSQEETPREPGPIREVLAGPYRITRREAKLDTEPEQIETTWALEATGDPDEQGAPVWLREDVEDHAPAVLNALALAGKLE